MISKTFIETERGLVARVVFMLPQSIWADKISLVGDFNGWDRSSHPFEHDPIIKERLFGLSGPGGNHGEDVKEYYYYLDNTPTHSYMQYLYKYPQAAYPYTHLVEENQ